MFITNLLKRLKISRITQIPRHYSQDSLPKPLRSLKAKSTRDSVQFYVDSCRVRAVAGNGGDGCISFLSAWGKEHAGPDGGDGGHGGHIIFQATHKVKSLNHCRSVIQAKHGERGFNKDCNGKNAEHIIVPVPLGTIVKSVSGALVADLEAEGAMFVAARGGAGGRGNRFFLTDTEQAPSVAEIGAGGETISYQLQVRSMAHVGLVGVPNAGKSSLLMAVTRARPNVAPYPFTTLRPHIEQLQMFMAHVGLVGVPNAGKSSLLRAVTRARPNVAPYPFTTLRPHIGMVPYDDYEQIAIADLPGLIPGSHKNYGLGIQFLQHIERCKGLIYLLDGTSEPLQQYETLTNEIAQYSADLTTRPSVVVVNKIDLPEAKKNYEEMRRTMQVLGISAKTGLNLRELLKVVREMYDKEGSQ